MTRQVFVLDKDKTCLLYTSGAVPVAAALFHKLPIEGKKVVCVISGGNIDVNILSLSLIHI